MLLNFVLLFRLNESGKVPLFIKPFSFLYILTEREVRITVKVTALHVDALGDSSRAFFPLTSGREIA